MILTLITLPSPSTMLADVGAWSSPFFTDLLPFAEYAMGIILAFALIAFLPDILANIIARIQGHKN